MFFYKKGDWVDFFFFFEEIFKKREWGGGGVTKYRPIALKDWTKVKSGTNSLCREVAVAYLRK